MQMVLQLLVDGIELVLHVVVAQPVMALQAEMATILTATGRAVPAGSERLHILLPDASQHL
jgi:hypothetical protein